MIRRPPIVLLVLTLLTVSCGFSDDPPQLATVQMTLGSRPFTIEVAANDADRQKGLMARDSMPTDRGMIFVFHEDAPRAFWMKNTRIALDIIFVNAAGDVVDIKSMQPYDLRSTPGAQPAKYAIEVNAGVAAACGVKIGDRLQIPPAASAPKN